MSESAILVSFNSSDLLCRAVESCLNSRREMRIVVVDNGSTDGSPATIRERFPTVEVVETGANLGFAVAVNRGAALAPGDDLLLVNPDAVLDPSTAEHLAAAAAAEPDRGLYGALIELEDGTIDPGYAKTLPTIWSLCCFATGLSSVARGSRWFDPESITKRVPSEIESVGMVSGCVVLVSAGAWKDLGGFDESYFMYAEDADLCARARALGYDPVVVPDAVARHVSGGTAATGATRQKLLLAGRATYLRRHWSPARARVGLVLLATGVGLRALVSTLSRRLPARNRRANDRWSAAWRSRSDWWSGYTQSGPPPWLNATPATGSPGQPHDRSD